MERLKELTICLCVLPNVVLAAGLNELDANCQEVYYHAQTAVGTFCTTINAYYQEIDLNQVNTIGELHLRTGVTRFNCGTVVQNPDVHSNVIGYNGCVPLEGGINYSTVSLWGI